MKRIKWLGLIVAALVVLAALAGWLTFERRSVRAVPILMYHHIGPVEDSPWWVPRDVFEGQMRALREQGYTAILPADLAAHQRWGKPLPRRPVILTFDDGYLDSLTTVEPILKQYGLRGIVYLITENIGATPGQRRQFESSDCLVWPEVRAMRRRGILTFGGHAPAHQNLAALDDPFPLVRECFQQIKKNAGFKPDSFCYPHGQYNDPAVEAVRRAGFTSAMACEDAVAQIGPDCNLLALPRVSVMGGRHRFTVTRAPINAADNEIGFRVKHEGVPLEVSARLEGVPGYDWLPSRELVNGEEVEGRWKWQATAGRANPPDLELWDKHRIFRLCP